jgi:hypothetical protein
MAECNVLEVELKEESLRRCDSSSNRRVGLFRLPSSTTRWTLQDADRALTDAMIRISGLMVASKISSIARSVPPIQHTKASTQTQG